MKNKFKIIAFLSLCFVFFPETLLTAYGATVGLIGVTSSSHDHTSYYDDIESYLNTMGYSDISCYTNPSHASVMSVLDTCEIIVTRSHGGAFTDSSGNYIGNYICLQNENVYNSDIEDLNANKLSNAKLIVYGGCLTAAGGISQGTERNLVVASEAKGAATVVGFMEEVACTGVNTWVKYFFQYLSQGYNIDSALNQAKTDTASHHWILESLGELNIDSCVYRGVWNATFTN